MESSLPPVVLTVAGIGLVAVGLLIVFWPAVLPWLVAAMVIFAGAGMIMLAQVIRGMMSRYREAGE